jgi:phosphoribosylformimino-5-aminoimidazole carboxamide ribotide isomerase
MKNEEFTIFPAIDLRGGKVVRLAQGDPDRQTTYGDDPAIWADRWLDEGARWLHIINMDGAFEANDSANQRALKTILKTAEKYGAQIEFGGGIRDHTNVQAALDLGVARVFLGTATVKNPDLVDWALAEYGPQAIAGDIGIQDGHVMVRGWQEATPLSMRDIGLRLKSQGVAWCVLTDVKRDGVNTGVDVSNAVELQQVTGMKVVASGGVSSVADVDRTRTAGLAGVIIGRALYEGQITIGDLGMTN